jgi:hypothetical protein
MSRFHQVWLVASFFVFFAGATLRADKPVWAGQGGSGNGNASTGGNWTTNSPPGHSSVVKVDKGNVVFDVSDLGGLEFTTGLDTNNQVTTGIITGSTTVTFSSNADPSTWDAGEINFSSGGLVFDAGVTLTIGTGNPHKLSGGAITNKGTTNWTGGSIDASAGTSIANNAGATFTSSFDGTITGGATFNNAGKFEKSSGTGATEIQTTFSNSGELKASSGAIKLTGGGSSSGTGNKVTVGSGAKVQVDTTGYTFDGTAIDGAGDVELKGGSSSFKGVNSSAAVSLAGGNLDFSGSASTLSSLAISSDISTVTTSGTLAADVSSLSWTAGVIDGKVNANSNAPSISGTAAKTIGAKGELTIVGSSSGAAAAWTGTGGLSNQGKLTHAAGQTDIQASFQNTGSLTASAGTLKFSGGGSSSGLGNSVDIGGTLQVDAADFTFDATTFSGSGSVELKGANTTFRGAGGHAKLSLAGGNAVFDASQTTADSLSLSSGTITSTNNGSASVGSLTWTGGSIQGKITSAGGMIGGGTISTGGNLSLTGATSWNGSKITTGGGAQIANSATFTASDGTIEHDGSATRATFNNSGNFNKSTGSGTTDVQAVFNNSGFVNADSGTLQLSGGGSNSGAVNLNNQAKLKISGSNYTFNTGTSITGAIGIVELADHTTVFNGTTGNSGELAVTGGTVTFNGTHNGGGKFTLSAGGVDAGAGSASFSSVDWSGGNVSGKVTSNGATTISDHTKAKNISGELTLGGTTDWDDSQINTSGAAKITNQSGATFRANADGLMAATDSAQFANNGTFEKTAGGATGTEVHAQFNNTGSIVVDASGGTLKLTGGGGSKTSGGSANNVNVGAGGKLQIDTGNFTFDATSFAGTGTVELKGATTTFKNASGSAKLALAGGNADFNGSPNTAASLALASGNSRLSTGNNGSVSVGAFDWTAGNLNGRLSASGATTLSGNDTKLIDTDGDLTVAGSGNTWSGGAISNHGKLTHTSGATEIAASFSNSGNLTASGGTLKLSGGGSSSGNVNLNGGRLQIAGGNFSFSGGTLDASSGGGIDVAGGTANFGGTAGSADVSVSGGTANFNGTHNGTGKLSVGNGGNVTGNGAASFATLDWSDGSISGTTLSAGGATMRSGAKNLTGAAKLSLGGTTNWSGGNLNLNQGAELTNAGTFNAAFDGTLGYDGNGARGTFKNQGVFNKSAGSGEAVIEASFNNTGTVNVNAGKLRLGGGASNAAHAVLNVESGAELELAGTLSLDALSELKGNGLARLLSGVLDANGSIAIGTFEFNGGELAGSHTFKGILNWNAGDWNTSGTTTIDAGATLKLNGSDHEFSGRTILNRGTAEWRGGDIRGGSGSVFTNENNFFDLQNGSQQINLLNTATFNFNNNGLYRKSGSGTTTVAIPFNNSSKLSVEGGTMAFTGAFTNSGQINLANNASVQFTNALNLGSGSLTGTGTITAPSVDAAGVVSPGNSPGTLAIQGDLTLAGTSRLLIELAGTTAGASTGGYDVLSVSGTAFLGGAELRVTFASGFQSTITSGNQFTILTATNGLTGTFANAPLSGQRFSTFDGLGTFQIDYSASSVLLSNFAPVPEPPTWALLVSGLGLVGWAARRKRNRRHTALDRA